MSAAPHDALLGCLLGTAVGDAVGLTAEGLSARRQPLLCPDLAAPSLLAGRVTYSDDTEHTCLVAEALCESDGEPELFRRCLARRLRLWLLTLPPGIGWATLRALVRLWCGVSPTHSGVRSAGNGPAMRAAILGVACGDDLGRLCKLVAVSTRLTHTDPRAEHGALAVALAAARPQQSATEFLAQLDAALPSGELLEDARRIPSALAAGQSVAEFAAGLGLRDGVTGYVLHTVPVALYAWLRHPRDYRAAVLETIRCGGDTDTTAAIVGGIVGAATGAAGIPADWQRRLVLWPLRLPSLAEALRARVPRRPPGPAFAAQVARNALLIPVVLGIGIRRCFPPYGP
jgi:ADP-ribosylglycohydrolase